MLVLGVEGDRSAGEDHERERGFGGVEAVGTVPSYCTSCSPRLGFDVTGVRDAVEAFLLGVGPERDDEPIGGAASGLQLAVANPVVDGGA
jgi:hypothetical protein